MLRHRGIFWGLAMAALLGTQAQASTVTLSVDLGGTVIYSTTATGQIAVGGANTALASSGSSYRFTSLSDSTTGSADTTGLSSTATVKLVGTGSTMPALSVDVVETGILAPAGISGSLVGQASVSYTQVPSGSSSFFGDYNTSTVTPTFTYAAAGTNGSGTTFAAMTVPGTVVQGYTLSNHMTISLSPSTYTGSGMSGTDTVSGGVVLTVSSVPEPASIVMFLTGMPLPLAIVFGLIRRRRAGAAA